jgi:hypothetical protein
MASQRVSLSEKIDRVQKSIKQFPAVASSLNNATDQLVKSVSQLDAVLKKFSIGIPTWVHFTPPIAGHVPRCYHEDIGYAKIGGRWSVAIRTVQEDEPDYGPDQIEAWPFSEAPRHLRVLAIKKIPELLEALLRNAAEMAKTMAEGAEEVDALTAGMNSIVDMQNSSTRKIGISDLMKSVGTGEGLLSEKDLKATLLATPASLKSLARK